jgi:hypothetical protein
LAVAGFTGQDPFEVEGALLEITTGLGGGTCVEVQVTA